MARRTRNVKTSGKEFENPVLRELDRLPDAAWGRIFGISRQSIAQWRHAASIPRWYMRAFAVHTGVTVDEQLECEELAKGILYTEFVKTAQARYEIECERKNVDTRKKRD